MSKLISRILGVSDSLVFPSRNVPSELTVDAKPNTQFNSFSLLLFSFCFLLLLLLTLLLVSSPYFVTYIFLDLLIFNNLSSHVILQFISSLFSLTVKMLPS